MRGGEGIGRGEQGRGRKLGFFLGWSAEEKIGGKGKGRGERGERKERFVKYEREKRGPKSEESESELVVCFKSYTLERLYHYPCRNLISCCFLLLV